MSDVMDLVNEEGVVFDAAQWIGRGRTYKDVPIYVCDVLTDIRQIPDLVSKSCLPSPEVPILDFINLALPPQSSELITTQASAWFSNQPPQQNVIELLQSRSIPPKAILDKLDCLLGQAWFDGKVSILDPRYNDGSDALPLWAPTYWLKMAKIISIQTEWRRAKEWIQDQKQTLSGFPAPAAVFAAHPWNMPLHRDGSMTNHTLAQLLSNRWLSDDIMFLMVGHLRDRLQQDPVLNASTIIAPSLFYLVIENAAKMGNFDLPALRKVEDRVKERRGRFLWMGGFIGGNHEIALHIDFHLKELAYGAL